uniref:Cytochrome P450 family 2 subfamily C member 8 n=1 Tax=Pseudonaja textilis TaxID=8673 RepID=A0A670Z9U4_PSETE
MDCIGPILIVLLFILAITFLLKNGSSKNNSSPNLPPGPRAIPILGNLHVMDLKRPYKTMIDVKLVYVLPKLNIFLLMDVKFSKFSNCLFNYFFKFSN